MIDLIPRALLVVLLLAASTGCAKSPPPPDEAPVQVDVAPDDALPAQEQAPIRREGVIVYYGSASGSGLIGELREIYMTPAAGDRAKQIVGDLIAGPNSAGAVAVLPRSTRLRQIYVLDDGTAWVDFSSDLRGGLSGGSAQELRAVYAVVDSLALNLDEIKRVGLLIEGRSVDTLTGHVDLRRPLPPDRSLIAKRNSG